MNILLTIYKYPKQFRYPIGGEHVTCGVETSQTRLGVVFEAFIIIINLSKKQKKNQTWQPEAEFAFKITGHKEIYIYNIFLNYRKSLRSIK